MIAPWPGQTLTTPADAPLNHPSTALSGSTATLTPAVSLAEERAMALIAQEKYAQALGQLRHVARLQQRRVFAYCAGGACFYKLKRLRSAERWLRKALTLDPLHRSSRLNLANTLLDLKQKDEAVDIYLALLQEEPDNLRFQINCCAGLAKLGRLQEALDLMQRILEREPTSNAVHLELARLLLDSSLKKPVLPLLRSLIRRQPDCDEAYFLIGCCLQQLHRHDEAIKFAIKATELRSDHQDYLELLIRLLNDLSMPERSLPLCEQLLKTNPNFPSLLLHYHLVTPVVFRSTAELHHYWARVLEGLRLLSARQFSYIISPYVIYPHLFFLAYHWQNLKYPLVRYYDLLSRLFGLTPEMPESSQLPLGQQSEPPTSISRPLPTGNPPIRIGFASEYFSAHSNTRAFEGLIRYLSHERFNIILIHGPTSKEDDTQRELNKCVHQVEHLSDGNSGFPDQNQIKNLDLDILFYPDLGMNCQMNYLAMQRLAPIQVTGWGLPHTSGLRTIDYYISSELAEPADGDDHYVETLVRLPGLPCCYLSERLTLHEVPRNYFMLPAGAPIFGCLQSLYKLHPQFDVALEQLAIANPEAAFVFVENPKAGVTQRFLDRVKVTAPHFHEQLVMLAMMHRLEFIALSNCIDVLLDPFFYCSGITFYESSYVGTPTVTLEGRFLRSRFVAAAYRLMGVNNPPIAQSVKEYVEIATRLINDREALDELRQELRQKAATHLYDDLNYVRGFEAFCEEAVVRHGLRAARPD
jgi:protein O-GlcNAc transferase